MKKVLIVLSLLILSGCSKAEVKPIHKFVDNENYLKLVELLDAESFNNNLWKLKIIENGNEQMIISENSLSTFILSINDTNSTFTHTENTYEIELFNTLTNETTIFKENITVNSLEHFSTIILDEFKEDFSYYSMKNFIPLAKELTQNETFDFYYENNYFGKNEYRLTGYLDELKLDNYLHNILLESSSNYQEFHDYDNPLISLTFKTDVNNTYFFSNIEFKIEGRLITQII